MVSKLYAKLILKYERPRELAILYKKLFMLMQNFIYMLAINFQLSGNFLRFKSRTFEKMVLNSF